MGIKISALTETTTRAVADVAPVVSSGATKNVIMKTLREFIRTNETRWREIETDRYTAAPASTSQLTMSNTSDVAIGLPVKYTISSVTYYGIVTALSASSSVTIAGASMGGAVTNFYVGTPEMVTVCTFFIADSYGDGVADLLAADMNYYEEWGESDAYLVAFKAVHKTVDSGANQPKVNVKIGAGLVSNNDTNNGLQLTTAGAWVSNSAVAINSANYKVERDDDLEVRCTVAGSTGDAKDLTVRCQFVVE